MSQLTKLKILNKNNEIWPDFLNVFVQKNGELFSRIDLVKSEDNLSDYLFFDEDKLRYSSAHLGNMSFDFEELWSYHLRQKYAISKEPLAKALGIRGETKPIVWDATAGTGKDLVLIHFFGVRAVGFERNPIVYLLLQDALRRFPLALEIKDHNCTEILSQQQIFDRPDVIYYDPMYPEKTGPKKSALPRKEMRIFKSIVGNDEDFSEFFHSAMKIAKDRVVVKRPLNAPDIGIKPNASYSGKSTRYDMYKVF